jgi:isochorismate hydrolase
VPKAANAFNLGLKLFFLAAHLAHLHENAHTCSFRYVSRNTLVFLASAYEKAHRSNFPEKALTAV